MSGVRRHVMHPLKFPDVTQPNFHRRLSIGSAITSFSSEGKDCLRGNSFDPELAAEWPSMRAARLLPRRSCMTNDLESTSCRSYDRPLRPICGNPSIFRRYPKQFEPVRSGLAVSLFTLTRARRRLGRASMVDRWCRSSSSKSPLTAQNLSASLVSGARYWGTSYRRHRRGLLLGMISIARCRLSVRVQRSPA
jgi:hypothetical protein